MGDWAGRSFLQQAFVFCCLRTKPGVEQDNALIGPDKKGIGDTRCPQNVIVDHFDFNRNVIEASDGFYRGS